jgi:hypothetical protein
MFDAVWQESPFAPNTRMIALVERLFLGELDGVSIH